MSILFNQVFYWNRIKKLIQGIARYTINNSNAAYSTHSFNLNNAFDDVTKISGTAMREVFSECTGLYGSIIFPDLVSIENYGLDYAFSNCNHITGVSFPKLRTVDTGGLSHTFYGCSEINTDISFPNLVTIYSSGMSSAFENCSKIVGVSFPNLTEIKPTGLASTFSGCSSLTGNVRFPKLTTVGSSGLSSTFFGCTSITKISFPNLTNIGSHSLDSAFKHCSEITGHVIFPKLTTIDYCGLESTFFGCTGITKVSFPRLTTVDRDAFTSYDDPAFNRCPAITEIHFRKDMESQIKSLTGYSSKFGANNATIYFDLVSAYLNIIANVSDFICYNEDGETSNPIVLPIGKESNYYIYKEGYCLYKGSKVISNSDEETTIDENVTLTTNGYILTLNITIPTNSSFPTTNISIDYFIDDILIKTDTKNNISTNTTQVSTSIKVPSNTQIGYEITAKGFKKKVGTATLSDNSTLNITLEALNFRLVELSYPFISDSEYLTNLVNGNDFVIFDDTQTPPSCIVSGPSSYHVDDGGSVGYIRFKTPDTSDTESLTVTVVCTSYAESSYDYGVVFINTTGRMPSYGEYGAESLETLAGSEDSSYGYILFQGQGNQSPIFRTVSKVLEPDTTYYLGFYYRKDGSDSENWDRLAIKSITLPVAE